MQHRKLKKATKYIYEPAWKALDRMLTHRATIATYRFALIQLLWRIVVQFGDVIPEMACTHLFA